MLTLYNTAGCPFCARARIVLAEKEIEHEVVEVDLSDRPAWLYEKNATGRVPVLEEDGWLLPESAPIMEYLEERYPEPPLLPLDPAGRALARVQIIRFDDFSRAYYAARRGGEAERAAFDEAIARLDALLAAQPFLTGSEYGLADIAYVPWLLRAQTQLDLEVERRPALDAWLRRLLERPAVAVESELVAAL